MPVRPFAAISQLRAGKVKLANYILAGALGISFVSFTLAHFLTAIYFTEVLRQQLVAISANMAQHMKTTLLHEMKKGVRRQQGNGEILLENQRSGAGDITFTLLGRNAAPMLLPDAEPGTLLPVDEKASLSILKQARLTHIYPVVAEADCRECHRDTEVGQILGYLRIQHDLTPVLREKTIDLFFLFLVLSPLPMIMGLLLARVATWRISRATGTLHDKIRLANQLSDFTHLDMRHINLGFLELNQILFQLRRFARKVKAVTVDKKILEFEIELLEKFIITSEIVRDWKEYVGRLLLEVNRVMQAYTMFSIFKVDDEVYDLEIFWKHRPSEKTAQTIERIILEKIREQGEHLGSQKNLNIIHNIVDPSASLTDLDERDISLQTKSLIMDSPRIGGVIGIGVQSLRPGDSVRTLVIDGILTTLLNVVGSIKAIYKYTRELEYYATRDPLTHLYNQRMFWELLGYEVMRAHRRDYTFTIIVIDFDNFKFINDNFGHKFGDTFLQNAASRIREALREGDILSRYGGDEFAIILPETGPTQAFAVAQRIQAGVENLSLTAPNGTRVNITLSQGLASYPEHGITEKTLFVVADNMMYRAKREGKNSICTPSTADIMQLFEQEEEKGNVVMEALHNADIVIPHFQPIMDIGRGQIEIHELLMRVECRGRLMTASEFVAKAEDLGAMHRLDLIIIGKAFEKISRENYQGLLFINLSPKSLIASKFIADIRQLANAHRINPHNIVFEITERDTVRNFELLEKFVADLKTEGFRFAVDDFGSGFSTFPYIKSFAIDFLKINGDFIVNMHHDPIYRAFVKSIVTLARELRIQTVAECVETEEILALSASLGIDFAQGFHISHPSADLWLPGRPWPPREKEAPPPAPVIP